MVREIIHIQIGQCGNQVRLFSVFVTLQHVLEHFALIFECGTAFWDKIVEEHMIESDGKFQYFSLSFFFKCTSEFSVQEKGFKRKVYKKKTLVHF